MNGPLAPRPSPCTAAAVARCGDRGAHTPTLTSGAVTPSAAGGNARGRAYWSQGGKRRRRGATRWVADTSPSVRAAHAAEWRRRSGVGRRVTAATADPRASVSSRGACRLPLVAQRSGARPREWQAQLPSVSPSASELQTLCNPPTSIRLLYYRYSILVVHPGRPIPAPFRSQSRSKKPPLGR